MRLSLFGLIAILILAITSCSKSESKVKDLGSDDALILAIQKASNKQTINISDLPTVSRTSIETEYTDDYADAAKLAPELGYEVDLRCKKGPRVGEQSQIYFDLDGRKLLAKNGDWQDKGDGYGDKGDGDEGDKPKKNCFTFVLPVTFEMPDGTEITIEEKEDWELIKAWYEANPDVKEKPSIEYPVDVKFKDGTVKTINNKEEMFRARKACEGDKEDKRRCFELVLPVTFTMPDDSEITIATKEDRQLIKAWYTAHPDVKERPELQFPVDIKWKDGTVESINSKEEMKAAKDECGDKEGPKRCFTLVLPVTHIMPDGTEIIIEKREDRTLIKAWYIAHPDVKERPTLEYPVDIKYKDGTVVTINSIEEMKEAKEACGEKDKP